MAGSGSPVRDDQPYFFLSYAHSIADGPELREFFRDLSRDVGSHLSSASAPGFLDRHVEVGRPWSADLAKALGTCRVFVPVLNAAYCASEWCGKEWAGFAQRLKAHHASNGTSCQAIVPVLWVARKRCDLAPMVPDLLQLTSSNFPDEYAAQGIRVLQRIDRWKDAYRLTVWELAKRIYDEGQEARLPPAEPVTWDSVPNAFAEHQARDGMQILVRIAAYPTKKRPRGAQTVTPPRPANGRAHYYGRTMRDWAPYRDSDPMPVAVRAQELILGMDHRPLVEPLDEMPNHEETADPAETPPSPSVMLVDPWVAGVPELAARLQKIDLNPIHLVVPWNEDDGETMGKVRLLQANLDRTLPNSLALSGLASRAPIPAPFGTAFKDTVTKAIRKHIETAKAYPPTQQPSMERPKLRPPAARGGAANG